MVDYLKIFFLSAILVSFGFFLGRVDLTGKVAYKFKNPVSQFDSFLHENKGITFEFSSKQKIINSLNGKVIHAGILSNYGNVVMIDHGNRIRSILLGSFNPEVKKGDFLRAGDFVGETSLSEKNKGKIYFEVRKKSKAQNTIKLLERKSRLSLKKT